MKPSIIARHARTPASSFDPSAVEPGVRAFWERIDAFKAPAEADVPAYRAPFSMVLPPPNVTGVLHVGHALTVAIQDAVARHRRMRGDAVCWVPGLDHAGIATQSVVERNLMASRGLSRHDIGRAAFVDEAHEWQRRSGGRIESQLTLLGASVDWSRRVYTLDDAHSDAVAEAFVRLHKRGLIYRGERMINWCVFFGVIVTGFFTKIYFLNTLQVSAPCDSAFGDRGGPRRGCGTPNHYHTECTQRWKRRR